MVEQGDVVVGADPAPGEMRSRRAVLSPELIAILAVGVMLGGVMITMMTVMMGSFDGGLLAVREEVREVREEVREVREEVREVQAGQAELRERMARVESKLDVLAGDWPLKRGSGTVE